MIFQTRTERRIKPAGTDAATDQVAGNPCTSFAAFWRLYLQAHRHPLNRAMHYLATATGIISAAAAIILGNWLIAAFGISLCYVLAIGSHFLIERNRSMMGTNPLFGYIADLKMCLLAVSGGLSKEYDRLGLTELSPQKQITSGTQKGEPSGAVR